MTIFLAGGGTGGATSPLLAVAEAIYKQHPKTKFFLVGSHGIEQKLLETLSFPVTYISIPAGKWRRYFSLWNFFDLFKTAFGFCKSIFLIRKHQPDLIFGAGSFVQVPLAWAGYFLKIPVIAHQQDLRLLLSTKLIAPIARAITVSFDVSGKELPEFSGLFKKTGKSKFIVTGNPVRREVLHGSAAAAKKIFNLEADFPTILVMGGSTGSAKLNQVIREALPELIKYVQVLHVTGGRGSGQVPPHARYHNCDFLTDDLKHAYAAADLVVSRGGMSTITELAVLRKPAIMIPLPGSAQEENVRALAMIGCVIAVFEDFLTPELLVRLVRKVLWDQDMQKTLMNNLKSLMPLDADEQIAKIILKHAR